MSKVQNTARICMDLKARYGSINKNTLSGFVTLLKKESPIIRESIDNGIVKVTDEGTLVPAWMR